MAAIKDCKDDGALAGHWAFSPKSIPSSKFRCLKCSDPGHGKLFKSRGSSDLLFVSS